MKTIKIEVELTYDDNVMHGDDQDAIDWFVYDVLLNPDEDLILHSNDIGDMLGTVKITQIMDLLKGKIQDG